MTDTRCLEPELVEALESLYARVPRTACQRKCQIFCGPLAIYPIEASRIREATGTPLATDARTLTCAALQEDGGCGIYAVRPLVCRVFGAISLLRCPHGCRPEHELSLEEADVLRREARLLSAMAGLESDTMQTELVHAEQGVMCPDCEGGLRKGACRECGNTRLVSVAQFHAYIARHRRFGVGESEERE